MDNVCVVPLVELSGIHQFFYTFGQVACVVCAVAVIALMVLQIDKWNKL